VTHPLHSLLHLVSISIAIGLAYIALERFRYAKMIRVMFLEAQERVYEILGEAKNRKDTTLTRIKRKMKDIEDGIGPKLLFGNGPKLFGSTTKYGFDSWCMGVVLSVQFIILIYVTINHEYNNDFIFWIIFGISCITTTIPLLFVYGGKWQLNKYDKVIKTMIGDLNKEYQLNINELQQRVDD
jgi:hypothetical protein